MNLLLFLVVIFAASCGGTVVLVGQDGVQRPPIHFPKGGHLLAFLSCLENGLLPRGQLDPPLWSHKDKGRLFSVASYSWVKRTITFSQLLFA